MRLADPLDILSHIQARIHHDLKTFLLGEAMARPSQTQRKSHRDRTNLGPCSLPRRRRLPSLCQKPESDMRRRCCLLCVYCCRGGHLDRDGETASGRMSMK